MKYLSFTILFFYSAVAFGSRYAEGNRPPRPRGSYCRAIIGQQAYLESFDRPLRRSESLPDGYWSDYRIIKVLDALVEKKLPLSGTYLLGVASNEGIDDLVSEALGGQPAATIKRFLSAVGYRYGSLGKLCKMAGVFVESSSLPEQMRATEDALFDALLSLMDAGIAVKSKDILQYYPDEKMRRRWLEIFGARVTGPMLWILAREYGYRWDEAVRVVRRADKERKSPRDVVRSNAHQKVSSELVTPMTYEEIVALFPSDLSRLDRSVYEEFARRVVESPDVVTRTELVHLAMSGFLANENTAKLQVDGFLKILQKPE